MSQDTGDSLHAVETCASEVLALRLALSLIENGAEPAGVIAAVRRRDALCAKARRALRANKDLNRALAVAKRTGIDHGRLQFIDRTDCAFTPGEARAILAAFAHEDGRAERADPAGIREEEWLPPEPGKTPDLGGEY